MAGILHNYPPVSKNYLSYPKGKIETHPQSLRTAADVEGASDRQAGL